MKQRITALLLTAALALSLLATAALAAEESPSAPSLTAPPPGSRRPRRSLRKTLNRPAAIPGRSPSPRWRSTYRTRWGPSPSAT